MLHNIVLPENEFNSIVNGKRHLIARDKGFFAAGDTLTVTKAGSREQMEFNITEVETERMFKGYCVLALGKEMIITQNGVMQKAAGLFAPLPTFQDGTMALPMGLGKTGTPIPADGRTVDAALPFTPEGFDAKDQTSNANFATDL